MFSNKFYSNIVRCSNVSKKFCAYLSDSDSVKPVKLAFASYENTDNTTKEAPLLVVHGLFGSKQNWTSLCKAYSQRIYPPRKVIALDLRNHGDSTHTDDHTYGHLAEDIRHFLFENGLEKIALMGHSMGGRCAMCFALKYPEFLEKLIVVDISPVSMSPHFHEMPLILEAMIKTEMPKNMPLSTARSMVDNQLASIIADKEVRAFILTNLIATQDKSYKWRVNIPTLMRKFDEISKFPEVNGAQYTGETLFLGGERSAFIPITFQKIQTNKSLVNSIRFKSDLVQNQIDRNIVDLAYASYQSTDTIFGRVNPQNLPTPLITLHGILGSKANFNTLCKRFHGGSEPKRLVYALDLRNHGDSAHSRDNSYDDLVMDVSKFLSLMNLPKVSILGHGIGGRVAMMLSLKYPEVVDKLIISDMSPITTSHNFKVIPEILRTLNSLTFPPNLQLHQAKAHVVNCLSRIVKSKSLMSLVIGNLVQKSDGGYVWRFNSKALLDHFQELSAFPEVYNVKFEGPVLFIGGAKSDYIQRSDYPKILKLFPKAELKYIEGAGHWVHAEKPNEFLKVTMEFLNKNASS